MNKEYNLLEPFELLGYWWHPDYPAHRVVGTLSFSPDSGITLELTNSILPNLPLDSRLISHSTILGQMLEGQICTIVLNTIEGRTIRSGQEVTSERYTSRYLLFGIHQEAFENHSYAFLSVQYTNTAMWLNDHPFSLSVLADDEGKKVIDYFEHKLLFQHHTPGRDCELRFIHLTEQSYGRDSVSIKARKEVTIEPTQPQVFDWYRELMYDIRNLLVLFSTVPCYILNVRVEFTDPEQQRKRFQIFFAQPHRTSSDSRFSRILLNFNDVQDDLPTIVDKWLSLADSMRPVHDLFFGYIYRPDVFITFRFLSLMQSLETYHRSRGTGYFIDKELYEQYVNVLLSAFPANMDPSLRQSLVTRLSFGNEYSLTRRLKELFKTLTVDGRNIIDPNWKDFAKKITDYRNYLTHYDTANKPSGFTEQNLFFVCEQLRSLLTLLLLNEIGIDEAKSIAAIRKNPLLWPWH